MKVLGMLSGTSADGISCVICEILNQNKGTDQEPNLYIEPLYFETIPWSEDSRKFLFNLFKNSENIRLEDICEGNFILGREFSKAALKVIENSKIDIKSISLIGSHGQTIWHQINNEGKATSTLQIGDISVIAAETGITTIGEFRNADIALGGQGAPLTSTLDVICLRPPKELNGYRALQNIGGIGNVTLISSNPNEETISFDTGPGNVLIDWFMNYISDGKKTFDMDGSFSKKGKINESLLKKMMEHPYFSRNPPKTTGRELFTFDLMKKWFDKAKTEYSISDEDFASTLTDLTAESIVDAYIKFSPGKIKEVVLSGGGSKNIYLVERIKEKLKKYDSDIKLMMQNEIGFDTDSKEAILFALLAYLTYNGMNGNIISCTGAKKSTILGKIAPGSNYKSINID